jgi:hypothetical protein
MRSTIGLPPLRMPSSPATTELVLAALAFELSLIAFLSPKIGEILGRPELASLSLSRRL